MVRQRTKSICARVHKGVAEDAIHKLAIFGNINEQLKIMRDGDFIFIPVKKREGDFEFSMRSFERRQISIMKDLFASRAFRETFAGDAKRRWVHLGDAMIIKHEYIRYRKSRNLEKIARSLNVRSIYEDMGISGNTERTPECSLIYGPGGETFHRENGIVFAFDPSTTMFSPGNVNVRGRLSGIDLNGKVIFDMFAGIGYFSLPLTKRWSLKKVYASEINPVSYSFLKKNVIMNKSQDIIVPFLGDCRIAFPDIKANMIIMGHFDSLNYISSALMHSQIGTLINFHVLCASARSDQTHRSIQERARSLGALVDPVESSVVKSYSPRVDHVSLTVRVSKFL